MPPAPETSWHLSKSVLLPILFALAVQAAGGVWFMSGLNSQVAQLVRANDLQDARINQVEQSAQAQAVTAATFNAQIAAITDTLSQIRQDQRAMNDLLRQLAETKR